MAEQERTMHVEEELLRRCARGDHGAYRELVERLEKPLINFILRFVNEGHVAEDIFQDTFVRVVRTLGEFRPEASLSTWIYTIARNLSLDFLKAKRRHREVREHLKDCAGCRGQQARLAATVAALEAAPPAASSAERRDIAVNAMAAAHAEASERLLVVKPRRWVPRGFAAGILILAAAAAALLLGSPGGLELRVAEVSGRADLYRADTGRWTTLAQGGAVRVNDRVITQTGTRVRFRLGPGSMVVDENTSIALGAGRTVMLDRGRLYAEMPEPGSEAVVIADTANNSVTLRRGKVEASLRVVEGLLADIVQNRNSPDAVTSPEPIVDAARRLTARVDEGVAELGGSDRQVLKVSAGRQGGFDISGQPSTASVQGAAPEPWWERE